MVRILIVSALLIAGSFGLLTWELSHGESDAAARTVVVNVIVFGELFYLFNCRSLRHSPFSIGLFRNRLLLAGAGLMFAVQLLFTYLPAMQSAFGSQPIGPREWTLILAGALLLSLVVEGEKAVRRWRLRKSFGDEERGGAQQ